MDQEGARAGHESSPLHVETVHGGEREGEATANRGFRLPEKGTKHLWQKVVYFFAYCLYVPASAIFFRAIRLETRLPRDEPFLLLANHTSVMDPAWTAFHTYRPDVHFMASSTLFNIRWLSLLIQSLGAFPKAKQVKDRGAMALMSDIYDRGGVVVMFPEGERTFDGRTMPVLPGIGRLLQRRHYQVVTARNHTGYFFQPRWAKYPRWVPIRVEYDMPRVYPEDMSPEDINADIEQRICNDMRGRKAPWGSFGFRMAHGLPGFLWACPACLTPEGLKVSPKDGNHVDCVGCGETFKVDVSAWIHPLKAGGEGMPVYEAYDRIVDALTVDVLGTSKDEAGRPIILESPVAEVNKMIRRGQNEQVAQGRLRLLPGILQVVDATGAPVWEVAIEALGAINLDVGDQLFIRHEHHLLRIEPGAESRVKWAHFLRHYHPKYEHLRPVVPQGARGDG